MAVATVGCLNYSESRLSREFPNNSDMKTHRSRGGRVFQEQRVHLSISSFLPLQSYYAAS